MYSPKSKTSAIVEEMQEAPKSSKAKSGEVTYVMKGGKSLKR